MTEQPTLDPNAFRAVMGHFATGISVVTCRMHGLDHAMTANSFTSVSLDPPLVLVCVERDSRFDEAVLEAGTWAVNILGAGSRGRARWFATSGRPLEGQFASVPHTRGEASGALLLNEAIATMECRTSEVIRGGDHDILLGNPLTVSVVRKDVDPLLYWTSGYRTIGPALPM